MAAGHQQHPLPHHPGALRNHSLGSCFIETEKQSPKELLVDVGSSRLPQSEAGKSVTTARLLNMGLPEVSAHVSPLTPEPTSP